MRIWIDLTVRQIERLDPLAAKRRTSRTALVREAIERVIAAESVGGRTGAFGLWSGTMDGQPPAAD